MRLVCKGFASCYEQENLARLFYPGLPVAQCPSTRGVIVYARASQKRLAVGIRNAEGAITLQCKRASIADEKERKLALSRMLYGLLRAQTGLRPPWGMLTGVRPVRLFRGFLTKGGEGYARSQMQGVYDVSQEKYSLAKEITAMQSPLLALSRPNSYSLYISIPFCPTRCAYCSFVSRTIEREAGLVEPYLDKLIEELALTARIAQQNSLQLETIYIGGGTPTALSAPQLSRLLEAVHRYFDVAAAREFTVEAGRPDCTSREKLRVLKQYGVGRISINPQTLNNAVLQAIGRRHTAEEFQRCFADARQEGHTCINTDLIAGLPGDTQASFESSLAGVLALRPENITVHTLTLKRASNLVVDGMAGASPVGGMLQAAYPALRQSGFVPYYLYRQKSTVENLENTGWTLPGIEGLYNIYIMEETHTILACGAAGSTKLVGQGGAKIQRVFNHKFPADYIQCFEEVKARKQGVGDFYASNLDT